ncbi:glycosyl transferase family 2 [Nocardia tenerifensis]|uniref:Glycosyl transferase family 2 n=1 Tax=Nocardia tenerifensis TaxID=228006 RepID=A0A318KGQ4_9NOCA|nr:glycosyltransferase [Nocardia tenerifensis]PXX66293.1 glycosyl transferase family 2 [Nocardia tenerifensis]
MSRLISVITPAYNPEPDYLKAACESVVSQELPSGWSLEWVIQEDGNTGIVGELLHGVDDRIRVHTGRRGGVALTRNLALANSSGELIKNLDADDILTPGVLARDIETLTSHAEVSWTTSRLLDLLPDGTTVGFDNDPPHGILAPGSVLAHWRSHNFRLPVHPTTICIRRKLVVALGGWMGVPGSDDTGMLIAASILSTGFFNSEVGLLYRKWPGQETAKQEHNHQAEWNARMALINERAEALLATRAANTLPSVTH